MQVPLSMLLGAMLPRIGCYCVLPLHLPMRLLPSDSLPATSTSKKTQGLLGACVGLSLPC